MKEWREINLKDMYGRIYTLAAPTADEAYRILNGRIFYIKPGIDENDIECHYFVDAATNEKLVAIRKWVKEVDYPSTITLVNDDGRYGLRLKPLEYVLPSSKETLSISNPKLANSLYGTNYPIVIEDKTPPYEGLGHERKSVTVYTFEKDITVDQFREYLQTNRPEKLCGKYTWFMERDLFEGIGTTWTHTHVIPPNEYVNASVYKH